MKARFTNVDIECWEHFPNRRFGRKPPFICLKAVSSHSPDVVLELIDELSTLRPPDQRSMTLIGRKRANACGKIRFLVSPESDDLTEMSLTRDSSTVIFEFTSHGLRRFREAVVQWQSGMDDFSIRPISKSSRIKNEQSGEVWFWSPFSEP